MKLTQPRRRTPYEKGLWRRKASMYAVWVLMTVACLLVSLSIFEAQFSEMIDPQIKRAYVKICELVPSFSASEQSLNATFDRFVSSRKEAKESGITLSADYTTEGEGDLGRLDDFTLDWVTQLNVGNHGSVILVDRNSGEILAHPDPRMVGKTLMVAPLNVAHPVASTSPGTRDSLRSTSTSSKAWPRPRT